MIIIKHYSDLNLLLNIRHYTPQVLMTIMLYCLYQHILLLWSYSVGLRPTTIDLILDSNTRSRISTWSLLIVKIINTPVHHSIFKPESPIVKVETFIIIHVNHENCTTSTNPAFNNYNSICYLPYSNLISPYIITTPRN